LGKILSQFRAKRTVVGRSPLTDDTLDSRMLSMSTSPAAGRIAIQRCDRFVGRTMNWMYDHFRHLPRYRPVVLAGLLENRDEFPEVEARLWGGESLPRRVWRTASRGRVFPPDLLGLRKEGPAVLHSHFGWVATGDHELRRALDIPWVVGIYGADAWEIPRDARRRARLERVFRDADLVLPLGPVMSEQLHQLGCSRDKLLVHNLGVDVQALAFTERQRAPEAPLRLLFAGTFREKKGVEYLVEAVHLLRSRGLPIHLDLVGDVAGKPGDSATKAEILARIARWDLEPHVTRHPFLPFDRLVDLAHRCHVLVAPSVTAASGDREGTVFVIQQMMATGMPVVSTRHADIPYAFGALSDRLVPERDAGALADALQPYLEDEEALSREGRRFRAHAEENLDIRVACTALADAYDSVIAGQRPRGGSPSGNGHSFSGNTKSGP